MTHHPASASTSIGPSNASSIPKFTVINATDITNVHNDSNTTTSSSTTPSSVLDTILIPVDATIPLLERCWCDFTLGLLGTGSTGFFSPFDVTAWEMGSYAREQRRRARRAQKEAEEARLKEEKERAEAGDNIVHPVEPSSSGEEETSGTPENSTLNNGSEVEEVREKNTKPVSKEGSIGALSSVFKRAGSIWVDFTLSIVPLPSSLRSFNSKSRKPASTHKIASTVAPPKPTTSPITTSDSADTPKSASESASSPSPPPLPPWTLDLRPHAMGLVIDFNWGRRKY